MRVVHHTAAPVGWDTTAEVEEEDLARHEPTPAERARTVLASSRAGVLSAPVGESAAPMAFSVPYAVDEKGFPIASIRPGVERSMRIRSGMQVCFTVGETPLTAANASTPGSVSVLAMLTMMSPGPERDRALSEFTRSQPAEASAIKRNAAKLALIGPSAVLVASGNGDVVRVPIAEYVKATSDPLAAVAPGLVSHLAADENGSLVLLCRAYGGLHDTKSAELVGIDQYGMDLLATITSGRKNVRIPFSHSVSSPDDVRRELTAMARGARFKLGAG